MKRFIKLSIYTIIICVLLGALSIQCGKSEPEAPTAAQKEENHKEGEHEGETPAATFGHLVIAPELIKQWNIQTALPETREYIDKASLNGVVKENKETTYLVDTPVCGVVSSIKKDIGSPVHKGDILCVLNSQELLELKTKYIKGLQDYRLKKENFDRAKSLVKIKGLEQKEFTVRETDYKSASAEYFSIEAHLESIGFTKSALQSVRDAVQQDETEKIRGFLSPYFNIIAPAAGKVISRDLTLGERIEPNKTFFEISDTRKLWAILDATEKDLRYIERSKPVTVTSDIYPEETFSGKIISIDERIDPTLRTLKIRAEIDNASGRLKPEMFVKGFIEKQTKETVPAVPSSALIKITGIDGVFVFDGEDFTFKPVEILGTDAAGFAFIKGIKQDEKVVIEGAFYLKAQNALKNAGSEGPEEGHNH